MSKPIYIKLRAIVAFGLLAASSLVQSATFILIRDTNGVTVDSEDVLAEARQRKVPEAVLAEVLKKSDNARRMASNIYVRRLLAREAEAAGLNKDPQVARQLLLAHERVLSDLRLAQTIDAPLDDAAVEKLTRHEYETNKDRYSRPETVRVRHILIDNKNKKVARAQAEALLARLKAGEDFVELAKEYSIDPGSKSKGGDLGFFSRGSMVKPFEDAAFALKNPGDLSDIIETQFGLHILLLEERSEADVKSYDEVKAETRKLVEAQVKKERHRNLVTPIEANVPFINEGIEAFVLQFQK